MKILKVYKKALEFKGRYLILYGGAGSGKSYFMAQKITLRLLTTKNLNILVVRKVGATIRHSVYSLFKTVIADAALSDFFRFYDSRLEVHCLKTNSKIIFKGLDDPEKLKSIDSIHSVWIEEATELTKEDMDQIDLRLRGHNPSYFQVMITFNPIVSHHWIRKVFFVQNPGSDDILIIRTTYLDNPEAGEKYKAVMERIKRDNYDYYRIYALGEWGSLDALVYPKYEIVSEMPQYFEEQFVGIDFGFNNPSAVVHVGIDKRNLYIDQVFYASEHTNEQVIQYVKKNFNFAAKGIIAYADSARPDLIQEWNSAGFPTLPANKKVFDGIMAVKSFNIHITQKSLDIIKEIETYSWKKTKSGDILDEPVKANDHAMDAIRYALTEHIGGDAISQYKSGKIKGV